jgi:hypothetical protein
MTDDLDRLIRDLDKAPDIARAGVRPVIAKGSLNIKTATKRRWTGLSNAPALPAAVTYDTRLTPTGAVGEIGPENEKRQGDLGNLIEYGSVNNAPRPGLAPSLTEEEPRTAKALEDLGLKGLPQ